MQVVHEIRNYPYPQLQLLALQGLNPSRHTSAVRESYEVRTLGTGITIKFLSAGNLCKLWHKLVRLFCGMAVALSLVAILVITGG